MPHSDLKKQLEGYGLTTARIFYRRPDRLWLLQEYIWQEYDIFPRFPVLQEFLTFWKAELHAPLHSIVVAHSRLIKPAEISALGSIFPLQ